MTARYELRRPRTQPRRVEPTGRALADTGAHVQVVGAAGKNTALAGGRSVQSPFPDATPPVEYLTEPPAPDTRRRVITVLEAETGGGSEKKPEDKPKISVSEELLGSVEALRVYLRGEEIPVEKGKELVLFGGPHGHQDQYSLRPIPFRNWISDNLTNS